MQIKFNLFKSIYHLKDEEITRRSTQLCDLDTGRKETLGGKTFKISENRSHTDTENPHSQILHIYEGIIQYK